VFSPAKIDKNDKNIALDRVNNCYCGGFVECESPIEEKRALLFHTYPRQ
jgi:hypothetical protein